MKLPFKPHLLVLLCSAGLFAASGVMFVKSRATEPRASPVAQQPAAPAPVPQPSPPPVAPPTTLPRKSISGLPPLRSTRMRCCRKF
jgi:hypothetical protein